MSKPASQPTIWAARAGPLPLSLYLTRCARSLSLAPSPLSLSLILLLAHRAEQRQPLKPSAWFTSPGSWWSVSRQSERAGRPSDGEETKGEERGGGLWKRGGEREARAQSCIPGATCKHANARLNRFLFDFFPLCGLTLRNTV